MTFEQQWTFKIRSWRKIFKFLKMTSNSNQTEKICFQTRKIAENSHLNDCIYNEHVLNKFNRISFLILLILDAEMKGWNNGTSAKPLAALATLSRADSYPRQPASRRRWLSCTTKRKQTKPTAIVNYCSRNWGEKSRVPGSDYATGDQQPYWYKEIINSSTRPLLLPCDSSLSASGEAGKIENCDLRCVVVWGHRGLSKSYARNNRGRLACGVRILRIYRRIGCNWRREKNTPRWLGAKLQIMISRHISRLWVRWENCDSCTLKDSTAWIDDELIIR